MATIELDDVQSNVLRGFRHTEALPHVAYSLLGFTAKDTARAFLAEAAALATSCTAWNALAKQAGDERFVWNLGFTYEGLLKLGFDARAQFPNGPVTDSLQFGSFTGYAAFALGARQRAHGLGDVGESAPANWQAPYQRLDLHAVVSLSAWAPDGIAAARGRLGAMLARHATGVTEIACELGNALDRGAEHFGFADGIGQPYVEGSDLEPLPGELDRGGDPVPSGEFVLGYPAAFDAKPPCDVQGENLMQPLTLSRLRNGSFLVFRKLREDVVRFRSWVAEQATRTKMPEELFAARLVGRWRSGAPLALAPTQDDPELGRDPLRNNDFDYAADGDGFKTPFGAHIRRANPRNDPTGPTPPQIAGRRVIRRAVPYGPPLPEGSADDGIERGILFVAINADIERQFEFVQTNWLNNTLSSNRLTLEADKDPLVGANDAGNGKFVIPGPNGPCFVWNLPRFVTVRGAAYFFLPGLHELRQLGSGTA